jgi:hypothetical protein
VLDCVNGDADVGLAIARQQGVAAIGAAKWTPAKTITQSRDGTLRTALI